MKLLTKELEARFAKVGSQENEIDPIVIAKYFNPCGAGTWLATEYLPEERLFFGYVTGLVPDLNNTYDEFGYFSQDELESVKCPPLNLPIERDLHFSEKPISEVCPELKESIERRKKLREMEQENDLSENHEPER